MPALLSEHETWFDEITGQPLNAGYVYIGARNLSPQDNLITIYSDRDLTTPIANPQRTDSSGKTENKIHVPGKYSIEVEDVNNVQKYINLDNGVTDSDTVDGFHASATAEAGELIALDSNKHLPADGFKFPSTNVPSSDPNVLDDYEEGTWTPTLIGQTTNPTQSYVTQDGIYRKIGDLVWIRFYIVMAASGISAGSGEARVGGLPFTNIATFSPINIGFASNWNATTRGAPTNALVRAGETAISLYVYDNDAGNTTGMISANALDYQNSVTIYGAGSYVAA